MPVAEHVLFSIAVRIVAEFQAVKRLHIGDVVKLAVEILNEIIDQDLDVFLDENENDDRMEASRGSYVSDEFEQFNQG